MASGNSSTYQRIIRRVKNRNLPSIRNISRHLSREYHKYRNQTGFNDDGIDVFEEDWDNLIILDACRYDVFSEVSDLPGTLESRISRGSMTREWVKSNFAQQQLDDVVYVTSNGNFAQVRDAIDTRVHAEIPLWQDEYRDRLGNSVTPPEIVVESAQKAAETYPNKRLLVHFVQPHTPYLGPTGERYDPRLTIPQIKSEYDVSDKELQRAYRENLELVIEETHSLMDSLTGQTVVTADHGELLGDRLSPIPMKGYGHPDGVYHDALVTVPWLIHDSGSRREITSEAPTETTEYDEEAVARNLKDLGYL